MATSDYTGSADEITPPPWTLPTGVVACEEGAAPMLPEPLDQIPSDQEIASIAGDGAFNIRKYHDASAARGAAAIIPPCKNTKAWKPDIPGAVARNEALRASQRFGRMIWRQWSDYHLRSRTEI